MRIALVKKKWTRKNGKIVNNGEKATLARSNSRTLTAKSAVNRLTISLITWYHINALAVTEDN